ncbi:hypothetical protein WJX73_001591 [Symbiochloris irregularis]|uniref:JmjC domain-containing protein n=1 Tax=Symbiochloris irregularis TaxID=706552 RepID=A0AAW1PKR6_9CHLO
MAKGKGKGRSFCVLCVGVQLVVLLGLVAWSYFAREEALLIRGAAAHWPVLSKISIPWLLANTTPTERLGTTIISPNSTFVIFTNTSQMAKESADPVKAAQLPARLELNTLRQFVTKYENAAKGPYYYSKGEHYYYQGFTPDELLEALLLTTRPLSCLNQTLAAMGTTNNHHGWAKYLLIGNPLLRLTKGDTTHIAHWDEPPTLMLQLSGEKDVWIVPRDQLNDTYPYPKGDVLFRRARVNITHPDTATFPKAAGLRPQKVRLRASDFLIFPGNMIHQLEAVTDSISMSFRMKLVYVPHKGKKFAQQFREYVEMREQGLLSVANLEGSSNPAGVR